jgi:hypothetical protein
MNEARKCTQILESGDQCGAYARHGKALCFRHDPESRGLSLEASRKGGLVKELTLDTPLESIPVSTSKDVVMLLAQTINEVRAGTLDPRIATTIGYLSGHLIKAFEVAELEDKIAELNAVFFNRTPFKKGKLKA